MDEIVTKIYTVSSRSLYNILLSLLKENALKVVKIRTSESSETNKSIYTVTAEGDLPHLNFVAYLLNKEEKKIKDILKGVIADEAL